MTKIKKVFARLFWSESQLNVILAADDDAAFNVNLGKLLVGSLVYSDGIWSFGYSDDFKFQNKIAPLANFPLKDKVYTTKDLWPFFASRVPSSGQRQVDKNAPTEDIVALLKQFGRKTITNPYELCPVL